MKKIKIILASLLMIIVATNVTLAKEIETQFSTEADEQFELSNTSDLNFEDLKDASTTMIDNIRAIPTHVVEYGPTKPVEPGFLGPVLEVWTFSDLETYVTSRANADIRVMADITFPSRERDSVLKIPKGFNKRIDLNKKTLFAGDKGQIFFEGDKNSQGQYFKIMNGFIIGNHYGSSLHYFPGKGYQSGFLFADRDVWNIDIVIEDITHQGHTGGFLVAEGCNMFFYGHNSFTDGHYNIIGGSVTFVEGTFTGRVTASGGDTSWSNISGKGTVNIAFRGKDGNVRRPAAENYGDRRVTILKNAQVELHNPNVEGDAANTNGISNFAVLTIDGSLKIYSSHPGLRSIASENHKDKYAGYDKSDAQTYNGLTNINVNEGSELIIEAGSNKARHGAIYTHHATLNAVSPSNLDIEYNYGTKQNSAFHSWNYGYLNFYNMDLSVWESNPGTNTGTPSGKWMGVQSLNVDKFSWGSAGNGSVTAVPDTNGLGNFRVTEYSKITSSNASLPTITPDSSFKDETGRYVVNNGAQQFFGNTQYVDPTNPNSLLGPVVNGRVELRSNENNKVAASTSTDVTGRWYFNPFSANRVKAGEYTIYVISGTRQSKGVPVTVVDTLDPRATPKLYMFEKGTEKALDHPEINSLASYDDETTDKDQLVVDYLLTDAEKERIINTEGYYEVKVEVEDLAGNTTEVTAPIIVYENEKPTRWFVTGSSFNIDQEKWATTSSEQQRIVREEAKPRGYEISGNKVTEITNDPNKFKIVLPTMPSSGWEIHGDYDVDLIAGAPYNDRYTKRINVHLLANTVKMTVRQVYKEPGRNQFIYTDLTTGTLAKEETFDVEQNVLVDDELERLEKSNLLKVIPEGYILKHHNAKNEYWMNLYMNGGITVGASSRYTPSFNFDLFLEYEGEIKFQSAPHLDYGEVPLSSKANVTYPLDRGTNNHVKVINTAKRAKWTLLLELGKDGILNDKDEPYLGELVYYDEYGEYPITTNPVKIEENKSRNVLNDLNMYSATRDSGIWLKQQIGNRSGDYKGDIIWSLTDGP